MCREIQENRPCRTHLPGYLLDSQHGSYRLWVHEHRFEERDGMTLAEDLGRYAVPGGRIVDRLFVRSGMQRIFTYRRKKLRSLFGAVPEEVESLHHSRYC